MVASVSHTFVSPVVDDGVTSEVGPNEWNAVHTIVGTFDSTQIAAGGVAEANLATDAVTSTQIKDGAVVAAKIATDTITSTQIAANAITSSELKDASVIYAKIQDVSAGSVLLGRDTSGAGDVMEIILGTNLSMSGSTLNATGGGTLGDGDYGDITVSGTGTILTIDAGVVNSTKLLDGGVIEAKIATDAVTSTKIKDGAVITAKIAAQAVTSAEIKLLGVTAAQIADNTITSTQIADDAITAGELAADAVTSTEIKDGAVITAKIAAQAVTSSEIKLLGVTAAQIATDTITSTQIATDGVASNEIKDASVIEAKIATDAVTSTKIKDGAVITAKIANSAVTSTQLATDAVTSIKILDGAVISTKLGTDAVTSAKILDGAVISTKIGTDAVTSAKILDGAVISTKIGTGAVVTVKIAAQAVTSAEVKLLGITAAQIANDTITSTQIAADAVTSSELATDAVTSAKILADAVISTKIRNDAVITAKILDANVTSTKIVDGGVIEAKIATDAVTSTKIKDAAVITAKIAGQAVTSSEIKLLGVTAAQIANDTITSTQIANDAVASNEILAGAVVNAKLATDAVTSTKIIDGGVTGAKIATDTITSTNIAADAITSSELKDASVVYAKIQDASGSTLLGRRAGSAGDVEEITLGTGLSMVGSVLNSSGAVSSLIISDAGFDVLVGWDDSDNTVKNMLLADIATEATPAAGDFVLIYGAEGDVRKSNWSTLPGAGGGISNVVEDTTPELGGDLETNNNDIIFEQFSADAVSAEAIFEKSRHATIGSHTVVSESDDLGSFKFMGSDGTNFETAAAIRALADGTAANNDMPGRLVFYTTVDGGLTVTEKMRITNAGKVVLGGLAPLTLPGPFVPDFQVIDESGDGASFLAVRQSGDAFGASVFLNHSRSATPGAHTVLQDGDAIGAFQFQGSDGDEFITAAYIQAQADGTPANNVMPGRLIFTTTPAASSTAVERFRIDNAGLLWIGDSTLNTSLSRAAAGRLQVEGTTTQTNAVSSVMVVRHTTTGTAANGIGQSMVFEQDTGTANYEQGFVINTIFEDTTSTSEDSAVRFDTMVGGALTIAQWVNRVKRTTVTQSATSTTGVECTELQFPSVQPGTYGFRYYLNSQTSSTAKGKGYGLHFTGTGTIAGHRTYVGTGSTAATAAPGNTTNSVTGWIYHGHAFNAFSSAAPNTMTAGYVATATDILEILQGVLVVTAAGNLSLYHSNELGTTSTSVSANTIAVLERYA